MRLKYKAIAFSLSLPSELEKFALSDFHSDHVYHACTQYTFKYLMSALTSLLEHMRTAAICHPYTRISDNIPLCSILVCLLNWRKRKTKLYKRTTIGFLSYAHRTRRSQQSNMFHFMVMQLSIIFSAYFKSVFIYTSHPLMKHSFSVTPTDEIFM